MLKGMSTDARRRQILAEIKALGPVLPGSLVERSTRCQRAGCHCHANPPQLHGPYATWMHQERGRQVTKTLTHEQAERLRPLIAADRRLRELIRELEDLTVKELNAKDEPVPKGGKKTRLARE